MEMRRGMRAKVGQHFEVSAPIGVHMRVDGPGVYDFSCFGVDQDQQLADDRYMVFYNQASSPLGEVRYCPMAGAAGFVVRLSDLPASIDRLVFAASIDGNGTMAQISSFTLSVSQGSAEPLQLALAGSDFAGERAIIGAEIYRKDSVWRIAAVGQGFNGGLPDLLARYGGVQADAEPAPAAAPPQPAPSAPFITDTSGARVSLRKGEKVSLKKKGGKPLTSVMVGLGWDVARRGPDIDCDASAILCRGGRFRSSRDLVYFGHLDHRSRAVKHMGDNLTGEGEGDDEQIFVRLSTLPEEYDRVVFVVNIYCARERGQHFGMIENAFIRVVDDDTGQELCRYDLSGDYDRRLAVIVAEVARDPKGEWVFHAIGEGTDDGSIHALVRRFK